MKIKQVREKDDDHLRHELADQQKQLYTLRTQAVTEKLEDPSQLRKARRSISRIKTVMRERAIQAAVSKGTPQTTTPTTEAAK